MPRSSRRAKEDWSLLIPYVLDADGARVSVADATKGRGYVCPECGQAVKVREGIERRKHCAHVEYRVRCEFREDGADRALARHALLHAVLLRAEGKDLSALVLARQCGQCRHISEQPLPARVVGAKLKYLVSHPNDDEAPRRADVALLDAGGETLCLVQIVRERDPDGPKFAGFVESPWILLYARRTIEAPRRLVVVAEGNLKAWDCPHCMVNNPRASLVAPSSLAQPNRSTTHEISAYDARLAQETDAINRIQSSPAWPLLETLDLGALERRLDELDELLTLAEQSHILADWQRAQTAYQDLRGELSDWAIHPLISGEAYQQVCGLRTRCIIGWKLTEEGLSNAV